MKGTQEPQVRPNFRPDYPRKSWKKPLVTLLCALTILSTVLRTTWWLPHFRWPHKDHPNNSSIDWHKCANYSDLFDCGTLFVPLDYTNLNDTRKAEISVIRYKAGGGKTNRDEVMGSVILNPGGPGGSGVEFLTRERENERGLANATDHVLGHKYDLVSFDPRGIGQTWPKVQCLNGSAHQDFYSQVSSGYGLPGHHGSKVMKHEIGYLLANQQLLGDVCMNSDNAELFKYMSTAFVCRDMQLMHRALGDSKLNYWGFSYGTVLGSTYAAMFPDDINRLIIDGVVNVPSYYAGLWNDNMKDIEQEFDGFFTECTKSGPDCRLSTITTGNNLKEVVMNWVNKLKIEPLMALDVQPPRLLSYTEVHEQLFRAMYSPKSWPKLADRLYDAIKHNNVSALVDQDKSGLDSEALYAIACSDAHTKPPGPNDTARWSIQEFEKHWATSYTDSPEFSIYFAGIGAMCSSAWQVRASEQFRGELNNINTSFPILALGNDFDPVTPGRYADEMAKRFSGAVSVRRSGYGHCSSSQPSKCIDQLVFNYFVNGELPAPGTHCETDSGPYDKNQDHLAVAGGIFQLPKLY